MTDSGRTFATTGPMPLAAPGANAAASAGRLLREARERQGLHIAALAASIKVTPKKLEMLEADRFEALPDATFTRALAQTVCRALKIDAAPVMQLLPPPSGHRLEQVGEGLNAPFRSRPGALVNRNLGAMPGPVFWVTGLILAAALVLYFLPASLTGLGALRSTAVGPAAVSATPAPASTGVEIVRRGETPGMPPETAVVEPIAPAASAAASLLSAPMVATVPPSPAAAVPGMLQLSASGASWVEVSDAHGQSLLARLVQAGETVGLEGAPPLKVRIGNASATKVTFRGQPLELAAFTRDNVARLELR